MDVHILYTKKKILERMGKHKECYAVCSKLIQSGYKVDEAEDTVKRLMPKIISEDEVSQEADEPDFLQSSEETLFKIKENAKTKKKSSKGSKRKKGKETNAESLQGEQPTSVDDNLNSIYRMQALLNWNHH